MSVLNPRVRGDSVELSTEECARAGKELHQAFVSGEPYPHVVIDDFLPHSLLRRVVEEFPERVSGRFANPQSMLKTGYQLEMIDSALITNLLAALNSAQFLRFLEELTGIPNLLADPYYDGGGLHETARGGHLSIHADFNVHPKFNLNRRLNAIVFLNEDWQEEWGGALELWDRDMKGCVKSALPVIGRAVIFQTGSHTFHGHPDPLQCPEGRYRRSMAWYYFTTTEGERRAPRTTQFQRRPGSNDKVDVSTRLRERVRDWCPPVLWRALSRRSSD